MASSLLRILSRRLASPADAGGSSGSGELGGEDGAQDPGKRPSRAAGLPGSVLFCCDHNAVRSPMAEGLMKKLHGERIFVQSAGVKHDMEVDPFAVAVCAEIGVELEQHKVRSFEEMAARGDLIDSYEVIVALSPAAQRAALNQTRWYATEVLYWPTLDPSGIGDTREQKLDAYRQARDQILANLRREFPSF